MLSFPGWFGPSFWPVVKAALPCLITYAYGRVSGLLLRKNLSSGIHTLNRRSERCDPAFCSKFLVYAWWWCPFEAAAPNFADSICSYFLKLHQFIPSLFLVLFVEWCKSMHMCLLRPCSLAIPSWCMSSSLAPTLQNKRYSYVHDFEPLLSAPAKITRIWQRNETRCIIWRGGPCLLLPGIYISIYGPVWIPGLELLWATWGWTNSWSIQTHGLVWVRLELTHQKNYPCEGVLIGASCGGALKIFFF